jgi:hypothetical protein
MRNIETFIKYMNLEDKLEMYLTDPNDLIGKKVFSIRSGFSSMGGTIMIVDRIENGFFHLLPEKHVKDERWMTKVENCYNSFTIYTPEKYNSYIKNK